MSGGVRDARVLAPTLAAAWIAFAQVVSLQGLLVWVVGGAVITALLALTLGGAGRRMLSVLVLVGLTALIPFLANSLGGDQAGPLARASLMSVGVAGAMAVMAQTGYPGTIIPASLLLLVGALGLGAVEDALWLTGIWSLAAVTTLVMLGPYGWGQLRAASRLVPLVAAVTVVVLFAGASFVAVSPLLTDPWTIEGGGGSSTGTAVGFASLAESVRSLLSSVGLGTATLILVAALLALVLLLILVAAGVLVRWAWVGLRWWRLRRRLDAGSPHQRAIGAWTWLRMQRDRRDMPLPVSVSPDVALTWALDQGEVDVLAVARVVAPVAFDDVQSVTKADADDAWAAAVSGGRRPRGSLRHRARWALRTPGRVTPNPARLPLTAAST